MKFSELLFDLEMSVDELSRISGVSKTTIYGLNSGKRKISSCSGRVLNNISKSLKTSMEKLLELKPEEYNPFYEKKYSRIFGKRYMAS